VWKRSIWSASGKCSVARFQIHGAPAPNTARRPARSKPRRVASRIARAANSDGPSSVSAPQWLESLAAAIDDYGAAGAGGTYDEEDPFLHERRNRQNYPDAALIDLEGWVGAGGNIAYRREDGTMALHSLEMVFAFGPVGNRPCITNRLRSTYERFPENDPSQATVGRLVQSIAVSAFGIRDSETASGWRAEGATPSRPRVSSIASRLWPELQTRLGYVDLFVSGVNLSLDLREPLPFASAVATHIYSEHAFEHFSYPDQANRLLAECLRVLAPGGVLDVGVPDTEQAIYDVYRDPAKLARARELWHRESWCDLPLHQLNYHFRQNGEHKYAWDYETLASVLAKAGFAAISRRDFEVGLDDEKRRGTLYIRAHKPTQ